MKNKTNILIAVLLALVLIVAGCSPAPESEPTNIAVVEPTDTPPTSLPSEEPNSDPITVVDDLGFEIVLQEPAHQIISISPSLTEILYIVGAGDRLIGRDSNSMYPEDALQAIDLGGMWEGIPVEDILAMEPDLILAGEIFSAEAIGELRELGLVVYWQENPDSFETLFENIMDISVLTGTTDQAGQAVNSLEERVDSLLVMLEEVEHSPLIFYELDASEPANPWTTGAGTFISYVINQAKGQNLGDSLEGEWVQISSEELIAQDPEIVLLADALYGITPESLSERAGWSDISAVISGEIYPFDPFLLSVPGPRLVDGFEQLAQIIHPEVFE